MWVDRVDGWTDQAFMRVCGVHPTSTPRPAAGFGSVFSGGFVLGTPFMATDPVAADQEFALKMGCSFAVFMVAPAASGGATDGAN